MKNFNVRLSAIGGFLLLVSVAFALAQHDSRKRSRAVDDTKQTPAQPAVPIALEEGEIDWHQAPEKSLLEIVRGSENELYSDDPAPLPTDDEETYYNPLRGSAQAYAVVTASSEEPANSPQAPATLPAGPPSWLTETLPSIASQAPPSNKPASELQTRIVPPLPSSAQRPSTTPNSISGPLPSLPSFPTGERASDNPPQEPTASPSALVTPS